jgi:transcription initiation factor TFIIB
VASDRRAVAVVVLAVALVGTAAVAPALAHPENETDHGVDERAFVILWSGDEDGNVSAQAGDGELAAASVYAACRCNGLPRTLSEIGGVAKVATDRVDHAYNVLNHELGLPAVPTPPVEYVPRPDEIRYRAKTLAEQAVDNGLANGCNSVELAAACVYVAARERGERVIQTDLAELANVTPVTLRARWKDLQPLLDE